MADDLLARAVLPDVLRVGDLCIILGRRPEAIRRLIRTGEIPARKLGGQYVVERRAFLAALRPRELVGAEA